MKIININKILLLSFLFLTLSCTQAMKEERSYFKVQKRWTDKCSVTKNMNPLMTVYGTYFSEEFAESYVHELSRRYANTSELEDKLKVNEIDESKKFNRFILSISTSDEKLNDLHKKNSLWKIYLIDDNGEKLNVTDIILKEKKIDFYKEFFPYVDHWSNVYEVKFPKYSVTGTEEIPAKESSSFKILISGIKGSCELKYKLK